MKSRRIIHIIGFGAIAPILVDGSIPNDSTLKDSALSTIVDLEFLAAGKQRVWKGRIKDYFFFKGKLSNLDAKGNKMTFSYATKRTPLKEAMEMLFSDLSKNGYKLDEEAINCFSTNRNQWILTFSIIVFIILIILFALW